MLNPWKLLVAALFVWLSVVLSACDQLTEEGDGGLGFGTVGTTTVALTMKLSNFDKPVVIEAPEVKPAATPISVAAQSVPTRTPVIALIPSPTPTRAPAAAAVMEAPREVTPVPVVVTSAAWTGTGSMGTARRDYTATLLQDGKVLIVGWSQSAEIFDPANGAFTVIGGTLVNHGQGSTATRLTDGRVLIIGGTGAQQAAEVYDPATGFFAPTGSLNAVHSFHSATLLLDGRVLVAGGQANQDPRTTAIAEIYDPATGKFSLSGSLKEHQSSHAAVLLPNGKVLIVGGNQTTTPGLAMCLDSAEVYDPGAGAFTAVGNVVSPRCSLVWTGAVVLNNGKVLITGGAGTSAELFDPATETFRATGNMTTPRWLHTATLLPNGHVLLSGGYNSAGLFTTDSAELYDPATESFSATVAMIEARQQHTATLLTDGQVLVAGGSAGGNELASAELFSLISPTPAPTPTPTPTSTQTPVPTPTASQTSFRVIVNSANDADDGTCDATHCSLREAINAANASSGTDTIAFNIPTTDPGHISGTDSWRIQPSSALPTITSPVTIDGYTQPGASPNTNGPGLGLNTVLKIELDGTNAGARADGLRITAGSTSVRGLAINRFGTGVIGDFSGVGGQGIRLDTNGGNVLEGNFIGSRPGQGWPCTRNMADATAPSVA